MDGGGAVGNGGGLVASPGQRRIGVNEKIPPAPWNGEGIPVLLTRLHHGRLVVEAEVRGESRKKIYSTRMGVSRIESDTP